MTIYFSWILLQWFVGFNLIFPLFLMIRSAIKRRNPSVKNDRLVDFAVVITAYQQTDFIKEAVDSILCTSYPNYHIYVVADNCDVSKLSILHPKVSLLSPDVPLKGNTKSHFYAIDRFVRKHDVITIVDSDNLVDVEYLWEINSLFSEGFYAVQGKRLPKNLDTNLARLDASRDVYYDFYDGKTLFSAGSSSTLSGSGMAFDVDVYQSCLESEEVNGAGFDKVLQAQLVKRGYRIAHAPLAVVYDQKSSRSQQFVQQRSRWMSTWFKYMHFGFELIWSGIKTHNWNQILFGTVLLRPPLIIFLTLSFACLLANLVLNFTWFSFVWILGFAIFIICFLISFKDHKDKKLLFAAFLSIPKFAFLQLKSLVYIHSANERSISTIHYVKPTDHD